jgi:hypothetical protein
MLDRQEKTSFPQFHKKVSVFRPSFSQTIFSLTPVFGLNPEIILTICQKHCRRKSDHSTAIKVAMLFFPRVRVTSLLSCRVKGRAQFPSSELTRSFRKRGTP